MLFRLNKQQCKQLIWLFLLLLSAVCLVYHFSSFHFLFSLFKNSKLTKCIGEFLNKKAVMLKVVRSWTKWTQTERKWILIVRPCQGQTKIGFLQCNPESAASAHQALLLKVNPANCVGFKLHETYREAAGCVLIQGQWPLIPLNTLYDIHLASFALDYFFGNKCIKRRKTQLNLDKVLQWSTLHKATEWDHKTPQTPGDEM